MESLSRREVIASLGAGAGVVALSSTISQPANAQVAIDISKDSKLFPAPPIRAWCNARRAAVCRAHIEQGCLWPGAW